MDGTEDNVSGSVLQRGVCLIDLLDKVNATLDTQILTGASLHSASLTAGASLDDGTPHAKTEDTFYYIIEYDQNQMMSPILLYLWQKKEGATHAFTALSATKV